MRQVNVQRPAILYDSSGRFDKRAKFGERTIRQIVPLAGPGEKDLLPQAVHREVRLLRGSAGHGQGLRKENS